MALFHKIVRKTPSDASTITKHAPKPTISVLPSTNSSSNYESDFHLTCPCNSPAELPPGIRDVWLFYHIGMIKNWKEIVHDQLTTLEKCGLGNYASSLTITYTNGNLQEIRNVLNEHEFFAEESSKINVTLIPGPKSAPWEASSMNAIYDACSVTEYNHEGSNDDVIVYYFHNKGASMYEEDWKDRMEENWSYSRGLYWRKYLEYFTLERPGLCLNAFALGAYTCGVEFEEDHYSGNFWSSSCSYIAKSNLKMHIGNNSSNYVAAEFWILKGYDGRIHEEDRFIGLFNKDWNLYEHLVLPQEYAIQNETQALMLVSMIPLMSYMKMKFDSILEPVIGDRRRDSLTTTVKENAHN